MAFDFLVQLLVNGFIIGLLYGVVAMSFVLIYKSSQVVNFAQGEFLLVGAWACWWLLAKFSMPFYMAFLLTPSTYGSFSKSWRRCEISNVVVRCWSGHCPLRICWA